MKPSVRFLTAVVVDGASYDGGDVVPEAEIPAGCLDSLFRLRQAERVTDPPVEASGAPTGTSLVPPPASKKASK